MCQGHHLRDPMRQPPSPPAGRARIAGAEEADLEAARDRLAESMVALERERARAAALRRRLAESYAERDRLRKMAAAMDVVRNRLRANRLRLQELVLERHLLVLGSPDT
ncbi:uncharacterized protein [Typha angustifolia]|uniref:uncharacterized protein isoform X2 n=1 Tax=Typha angustifolia TaxID=59011 RepID=UPI003C2EBE49